jgi:hypothetical protein
MCSREQKRKSLHSILSLHTTHLDTTPPWRV